MRTTTYQSNNLMLGLERPRRLGEILQQAALISDSQIAVAAHDQTQYADMRFGEILAVRGWLRQATADFFAEQWTMAICQSEKQRLGDYLQAAALIEPEQIDNICHEQWQTGLRFGSAAVLLGFLKQPTLDFFLTYLFPEERLASSSMKKRPDVVSASETESALDAKATLVQAKTTRIQPAYDPDDVPWIG